MTDKQTLRNFVNGEYVDPVDGGYSDLVDPCTGEVFAQAPISSERDVDLAMSAAATAFESWRDATPAERQKAMLKFADAVESRAAELVDAEVRNTGKPRQLTADEELPRPSTSCASSPAPPGCWRGARPASTWRATPRTCGASRSASSAR
ncbi:hypothetical protein Psuf_023670 [Phytohabitans suffuscus]|uniref:Aldehyde dehydrogenase domain-containing protein n=1 Tax=Phytohabitans suffuscus TaxID=624315 RepID=A0A6F8YFY6_9ACTN|nr:hypothetical protein Psuf_023670 [Phytohabitans suffuscus]